MADLSTTAATKTELSRWLNEDQNYNRGDVEQHGEDYLDTSGSSDDEQGNENEAPSSERPHDQRENEDETTKQNDNNAKRGSSSTDTATSTMEETLERHVETQREIYERKLKEKIKEVIYPNDFKVAYRCFLMALGRVCQSPNTPKEKLAPYQSALKILSGTHETRGCPLYQTFQVLGERRFLNSLTAAKEEMFRARQRKAVKADTSAVSGQKRPRSDEETSISHSLQGSFLDVKEQESKHGNVTKILKGGKELSEKDVAEHCVNVAKSAYKEGFQHACRRFRELLAYRQQEQQYLISERSLDMLCSSAQPPEQLMDFVKAQTGLLFQPNESRYNTSWSDIPTATTTVTSGTPPKGDFHPTSAETSRDQYLLEMSLRLGVQF